MRNVGDDIIQGLKEAVAYAQGDKSKGTERRIRVPVIDVKELRKKQGMSQAQFAVAYGLDVSAIQKWEQGLRRPAGPARVLLQVIEKEPEAVERALAKITG